MHLLYFFLYFFDVYFAVNRVFFSKFGELFVNNCTIIVLFVFLSLLLRYEKYVQTYGVAHYWAIRRFSHQIGNLWHKLNFQKKNQTSKPTYW